MNKGVNGFLILLDLCWRDRFFSRDASSFQTFEIIFKCSDSLPLLGVVKDTLNA